MEPPSVGLWALRAEPLPGRLQIARSYTFAPPFKWCNFPLTDHPPGRSQALLSWPLGPPS